MSITHYTTIDKDLDSAIRKLVESNLLACDFESGLCRYCLALVEHGDSELLEPHRPECPWQKVRSHYLPAGRVVEFRAKRAA